MDVKYITPELSGLPWTCFEYAIIDIFSRFKPQKYQNKPLTEKDVAEIIATAKRLNLPKLTDKQIEANYRKHIMKKYGKGLP